MAVLVLENVTKTYGEGRGAVTALENASISVDAGELVAIVGPSGSGKTTMLSIAGALLQPTSGKVHVNGVDVASLNSKQMADLRLREIGFVLQSSNLIPFLRARDQVNVINYLAGKNNKAGRARADELLERLGLGDRKDHYPEELSGGERQRVAIARALVNDPSLILADEPTANLDSRRGHQIVEMLTGMVRQEQKAGVIVTHDERLLDLMDRVYRIEDGILREATAAAAS
ncbi:MAG TPA: ABC transporter ATP-binding protein [Thermomicrobiales bacterium]|nr:ABC transporter ATP-binding protein [Thermomicrobiales bacterium]